MSLHISTRGRWRLRLLVQELVFDKHIAYAIGPILPEQMLICRLQLPLQQSMLEVQVDPLGVQAS
jgi:hypothetical protein